ncbi:MAG: hypothetical protein RJA34_1761 [Pseudomonadota bacterium]|jgi:hypothetical protein
MPQFTSTGTLAHDLWLADGSPDFATFPAGIHSRVPHPIPIWLKVGTPAYGSVHIMKRHGLWVHKQKKTVAQLVWDKLGQQGRIWTTEKEGKLKINLHWNPSALLILELQDKAEVAHFSVTSLYLKQGVLDGIELGVYPGRPRPRLLVGAAYLASRETTAVMSVADIPKRS